MFLYQGWYLHKEKETSFLTSCMANFGLTATSLFEIWGLSWCTGTRGNSFCFHNHTWSYDAVR